MSAGAITGAQHDAVGASVLFVAVALNLNRAMPIAIVSGMAALVCIGLAEVLVDRLRFYRFGVEEALAVASVLLLSISGAVGEIPAARCFPSARRRQIGL